MKGEFTIWHNPSCGTSRNVLGFIREAGIEPTIVEYLKTPPDRATIRKLLDEMGITARQLLREKEKLCHELGLNEDRFTDEQLIDQMLAHPILINRPIVRSPNGTRLCRPSETVKELLGG